MKLIAFLLLFRLQLTCFAVEETNIIASGDWSAPVGHDAGVVSCQIRGRLLIWEGYTPGYAGERPEIAVYLELNNVSVGRDVELFVDISKGLHCDLLDARGKRVPDSPVGGSGGGGGSGCWITLPYDSTIRLRVNAGGWGTPKGERLAIRLVNDYWLIRGGDTNDYFLSGTFSATVPKDYVARAYYAPWQGALRLPKMKIAAKKP